MTENNYENSKNSSKCWICKIIKYNKEYVKVERSLAGKYWSQICPKDVPPQRPQNSS